MKSFLLSGEAFFRSARACAAGYHDAALPSPDPERGSRLPDSGERTGRPDRDRAEDQRLGHSSPPRWSDFRTFGKNQTIKHRFFRYCLWNFFHGVL